MSLYKRIALLVCACGMFFGSGGLAVAQEEQNKDSAPPKPDVKILSSVDVNEKLDGKPARATTIELTLVPGASSLPHRHPGPVMGYVIEGEFDFQAGDQPLKKLKAGETFYEPAMALHKVSRNPSKTATARVLAVMLHPRDAKQLVIPEPAKAKE